MSPAAPASELESNPLDDAGPAPGRSPVTRESLHALSRRRDGPALVHLAFQGTLFGVSAVATARLGAAGNPWWLLTASVCGVAVLTFFPMLHEAGHQTAFASRGWNELAAWLGALFMGQCPAFFREFHWAHHRSTQDREHDPEISSAPSLLDGWPGNPIVYLGLVSGQMLLVGKLFFTLSCALLPQALWSPQFPFVREHRKRRLAWESRLAVLLIGGSLGFGLAFVPGFAYVLVAWPIAHLLLGLYLLAEHTGLPNEGTQLERTRSVESNALVRWLMWNMPYHAEHHLHPGVPFHALPALSAELAPVLVHTARSYTAVQREALRHALHLR